MEEMEFVCLACHDPHGGKDRFFVKEEGIFEETVIQDDMLQLENSENDRVHETDTKR